MRRLLHQAQQRRSIRSYSARPEHSASHLARVASAKEIAMAELPDTPARDPASLDIVFPPSVREAQERRGSRSYDRHQALGGMRSTIDRDLAAFLADRDSAYLATASAEGQPYIQHRGGPKGFLRVLDERTIGFADYGGNKQYITAGNLAENERAYLFLMDYATRRRVKIWGRAHIVEDDPVLLAQLFPEGYAARPERVVLFRVAAWDINCPQHIPQKFDAADVAEAIARLQARIAELEAENARLRVGGEADALPLS
jgi:predicted pyridoxine 5'-phosphate oxidase superfamily flavin-nucleotide-binding protein